MKACRAALLVGILSWLPLGAEESARVTPTVRLIETVQPGVVAVFSQSGGAENNPGGGVTGGSGSVIHEDGFVLTADHVVRNGRGVVLLSDGTLLPGRTVGRLPEKDLALLKVEPKQRLTAIALGRSHDLRAGEPIVVGGNPGGRGIVFSSGIVSSPAMMVDAPSALVMTAFQGDVRDRYIQFDATSNAGNSGGPLINAEGVQIGVVCIKFYQEQNINFAIPADRVRRRFAELAAPEETSGFWLGVQVDLLADRPVITQVEERSPAAGIGLRAGDVLLAVNHKPLRSGVDWVLACVDGKPGQTFTVGYERSGKQEEATMVAAEYPLAPVATAANKKHGLRYRRYEGRIARLDELSGRKAVAEGMASSLEPARCAGKLKEYYALVFEGFIQVPSSGLYRFILASDDGSRLFLDGRLLLDNDGFHPPQEVGRNARLAGGLHAVRLEYFQARGEAVLKLEWQAKDGPRRDITESMLWCE